MGDPGFAEREGFVSDPAPGFAQGFAEQEDIALVLDGLRFILLPGRQGRQGAAVATRAAEDE